MERSEKTKTTSQLRARRVTVAPMMEWTDRFCRAFHRSLSRDTLLYTEMVASAAVIHGDRERLLGFRDLEHPLACQLGGSDPVELAEAARIVEDFGYDEVNINVGCPSDRVQSGRFGACLMREPGLVGECVAAMKDAVSIPVTVKCRIGVDDQDPEPALDAVADAVVAADVDALWVHARKAWLKGLSPKENRDIPPLDYDRVYRLKQRLPDLFIGINGGITDLDEAETHLARVDGVMLGRAAYHDPWVLARADTRFLGAQDDPAADRFAAVEAFRPFLHEELSKGVRANQVMRHMLGLFHGMPGARAWRRRLTVDAVKPGAGMEVLDAALREIACVDVETSDRLDKSAPLGQTSATRAAAR
ncbi:tRNA dihydrouridine(20/20a) synthase DusA [Stappia sp.]|uniref:tRNA dihydrouridine(20/20a) synthase DusA n=1 Tax=Stappia sp. TaxID=1870903 RepID=UPI003A991485